MQTTPSRRLPIWLSVLLLAATLLSLPAATASAYMHPTAGRWLQRDPAGYVDGMGLYEYCTSDTAATVDPYGREGQETIAGRRIGKGYYVQDPQYYTIEHSYDLVHNDDGTTGTVLREIPKPKLLITEYEYWQQWKFLKDHASVEENTTVRRVRKCHVVVELDHVQNVRNDAQGPLEATHFVYETPTSPQMRPEKQFFSAVGTLSCWADSYLVKNSQLDDNGRPPYSPGDFQLNYVYGKYWVGPGDYDDMKTGWYERAGTIKGFPFIYTMIGHLDKGANSGYGKGKEGFNKLLNAAWESALKQGESFASDEYCPIYCKEITVVFVCSSQDAKKYGGEYCGKKKIIPVKNVKEQ